MSGLGIEQSNGQGYNGMYDSSEDGQVFLYTSVIEAYDAAYEVVLDDADDTLEFMLGDQIVSDSDTAVVSEAGKSVSYASFTTRIGGVVRQSDRLIDEMIPADLQGTAGELTYLGQIANLDNTKVHTGADIGGQFGNTSDNGDVCEVVTSIGYSTGDRRKGQRIFVPVPT